MSGAGAAGRPYPGYARWRPNAERAAYFATVGSDYISFADPPRVVDNSTDFCIEVVIRPRATMGVYDTPISKHNLTQGLYFSTNNPATKVFFAIDDVDVGLTFPLASVGEARYYCVSYINSTLYGYSAPYDGTQTQTLSTVGTAFPAAPTTTNAAIEIGGLSAQAVYGVGYAGEILWARWWNKGLPESTLARIWNRRLIPGEKPPPGLAFWWDAAIPRRDLVSGLIGTINGTVALSSTYGYPKYFTSVRDRRYNLPLTSIEAGSTNTTVTPGAASLTLSAFAPTVTASDHKLATPGAASLSLTGFAPTVTVNTIVTPGAAALTLTGLAPTVTATANQSVTPGAASLTLTGFAPTVTAGGSVSVTPGAATLTLTGLAPTVTATANQSVTPGTASLTLTGLAPTVTVSSASTLVPGTASLTLTGFAPAVTATANQSVTPSTASLTLTGYAPTVSAPRLVTPGIATLTLTGYAPTVTATAGVFATPSTATLVLTAYAPSVVATGQVLTPLMGRVSIEPYLDGRAEVEPYIEGRAEVGIS